MHYNIDSLDFAKILNITAEYAFICSTKEAIFNISPKRDIAEIEKELASVDEMRKYYASFGSFPFAEMVDIIDDVIFCQKGRTIKEKALLNIKKFLVGINNIRRLKSELDEFPLILEWCNKLSDFSRLIKAISKCINDLGQINDNASNELFKIRVNKKALDNRLRAKMQEIITNHSKELSDNVVVLRNNAFCLSVKAEHKYSFKGVIHDESQTRTTVYIEPYETLEISNQIASLEIKEKEEIEKILSLLSLEIASNSEELITNIKVITKLDLISAKAIYAHNIEAIKPNINENGIIDLKGARHPLIKKEEVVSLDIEIGKEQKTIIITGPNTGGKTVCLKTVGLLSLMTSSGFLIPAKRANMAIFDNIFVDIGDEQSIEQSLSTFSSHMSKIIKIVDELTSNSLILLDELGGGTDPTEGSSLAISLLKYFIKQKCIVIITTHYEALKSFAYENEAVLNASMEFSNETYLPTYRLILGVSGKSNAFLISKHLGLKDEIIKEAQNQLGQRQSSNDKLMKNIEEKAVELTRKEKELEEMLKKEKELALEYEKKLDDLNASKNKLIKDAKKKAEVIYANAQEEALNLIKDIEKLLDEQTKIHQIADAKHKARSLGFKQEEEIQEHDLKIDDYVEVIPYNCLGQITKINKDKYVVRFGNLSSEFSKKDLRFTKEAPKKEVVIKKTKPKSVVPEKNGKMSLDLRGKRYLEAMEELDKFLDDAVYSNLQQVTIIHGFGTGAIRKGVQEVLKKSPYVKEFRYGQEGEGLNGVTVATLK